MRPSDRRVRLTALAVFLGPILIVKALDMSGRSGPGAARADTPRPVERSIARRASVDASVSEGPEADRAQAHAQSLALLDHVASPFYHAPEPQMPPAPVDETGAVITAPPPIRLQGVMGGASPLAVIQGKLYRIGDTFEGPWIITAIDAATRSITLTEEGTDRSFTVAADQGPISPR